MDSQLKKLKDALESAVEGMSREEMDWHPAGKWNAGEVLEHLYLTYTGTIRGFEKTIAAGKPLATRVSAVQRLRKLVVLGFSHMPEGRTAPANTVPKGLPSETVLAEVIAKITAMDAIIQECEKRFGSATKLLDHPVLGPLTAAQWRKFHLVHGWHHAKQVLRLRQAARGMEVR